MSPPDLHPSLEHLAFLVGTWEGVGALADEAPYLARLSFEHDGGPFLSYSARSWLLDEAGGRGAPGPAEQGFWRAGEQPREVEVVLTQPEGVVQVLVGSVAFRRVELVSDLVARTATGRQVSGASRLYGGVEDDLAFVVEEAVDGRPLGPVQAARLARVTSA